MSEVGAFPIVVLCRSDSLKTVAEDVHPIYKVYYDSSAPLRIEFRLRCSEN